MLASSVIGCVRAGFDLSTDTRPDAGGDAASSTALLSFNDPSPHGATIIRTSKDVTYTVKNDGAITATSMELVPLTPPWSLVSVDCDVSLEPGATCTVTVRLTPASPGPKSTMLRLAYDNGKGVKLMIQKELEGLCVDPPAPEGYVLVPPSISGLSYYYYLMKHEATIIGELGKDIVSTDEKALARCSFAFHVNRQPTDPSCGSRVSGAKATSRGAQTPTSSVSFAQAFWTCRNASDAEYLVRLPTREEWLRASKWDGRNYQAMWSVYSDGSSSNCVVSGGIAQTGSRSACVSNTGAFDMAGNVSEWVDERMVGYDIPEEEARFGQHPVIGRTLRNGIDGISRRYHGIDPGMEGLALTLGADFSGASHPKRKQYGAAVEKWVNPTAELPNIGFRCVAFPRSLLPKMAQLALPGEPIYALPDGSFSPSRTIPENLYPKDVEAESVTVNVTGDTTDPVAEGEVVISWSPWGKRVCENADCFKPTIHDRFTYRIYRFIEPTRKALRPAIPWALGDPANNPYTSDLPLDPLAIGEDDRPRFTPIASIAGCGHDSPTACTFTDEISPGTDFSPEALYNYLIVAVDMEGNAMPAMIQRFRSPYFAGDPPVQGAPAFRTEHRYRRAGVFLIDEGHQNDMPGGAPPQVMVHVPLDRSGLDHDFFIQKYEASTASGTEMDKDSAASQRPLQGLGNTWLPNAAECHDEWLMLPGVFHPICGKNITDIMLQSKKGTLPTANIKQGSLWKACRLSAVTSAGLSYRLYLPSSAEWSKAADWGDTDHDGVIDVHESSPALIGQTISTLEYNSSDTDQGCNTGTGSLLLLIHKPSTSGSASRASCQSRYGVSEIVGSNWEWVTDQTMDYMGYDNGMDGLWLDHAVKQAGGEVGSVDLLRASVPFAEGAAVSGNKDHYWIDSGMRASYRGGASYNKDDAGRWAISLIFSPAYDGALSSSISGRCGL